MDLELRRDAGGVVSWRQEETVSGSSSVFNIKDSIYGAVGDGVTDDTAAIDRALADIAAAGRGTLLAPPGIYLTRGGHVITVPMMLLGSGFGTIGAGNGSTVFSLANGANSDMFTIASKVVTLKDFGLYGNSGNQTSTSRGIVSSLTTPSNYFRFEDVWVDSFRNHGVFLQGPGTSLEGVSRGLKVTSCLGNGIRLDAGSAADCQFTDCVVNSCGLSGFYVNAADTVLTNCHSWGNGVTVGGADQSGLFMPSGAGGALRVIGGYYESNGNSTNSGDGIRPRGIGNQIIGAVVYNNRGRGIYAFSNTGLLISGCSARNNNLNGGAAANGAGIVLDTCTASSTIGNYMGDSGGTKKQTYGYAEVGTTCVACLFSGNVSRATDHLTGNWLIGAGATPTIPATPASFNVG